MGAIEPRTKSKIEQCQKKMMARISKKTRQLNPNLKQHCYKTDRQEPLTNLLAVKVPQSLLKAVQAQDNWPEWVREVLQKALDAKNPL